MYKRMFLGLLCLWWCANSGWCATGAEFLLLDVPARSDALAAGAGEQGGSGAVFKNPAGILGQYYPSLSFSHFVAFQEFNYEQLEGVLPGVWGGTWAGRVLYAGSSAFAEIDPAGEEIGRVQYHDLLLHLAYAHPLGSGLEAGIGAKIFESQLAQYQSQGAALDAGLRYQTDWPWLALGFSIQNLGVKSAFAMQADVLPQQLVAGLAVKHEIYPGQQVQANADFILPFIQDTGSTPAVGIEYTFQKMISLRSGYRWEYELGSLSLGAGFYLANWGLDYAFRPYAYLGETHHFTLTYYFLPTEAPAAEPPEVRALDVTQDPAELSMTDVKLTELDHAKVRELVVLPRNYESTMVFKTPAVTPGIKTWHFEIRDESGRLVKDFSGQTPPPKYIHWDGRNQSHEWVPQKTQYQFIFSTDQKPAEAKVLPAFQPVYKFKFERSEAPLPGAKFKLKNQPELKHWTLTVFADAGSQPLQIISGTGRLPEKTLWDGKNGKGLETDARQTYHYTLEIIYPDDTELTLTGRMVPIPARELAAPQGKKRILVLGILFDFNSAVLQPEMQDKITAAAEVLQDFGTDAKAVCEGHADDIGGIAFNQNLSLSRAHMVAKFMARQPGVSAGSIAVAGYGKLRPENRLNTDAGRERNRRVEIRLTFPAPIP